MGARDRRRGRRGPEAGVGRTKEKKISVAGRRKPRSPPPDGPGAVAVAPARARVAGELKRQAGRGLAGRRRAQGALAPLERTKCQACAPWAARRSRTGRDAGRDATAILDGRTAGWWPAGPILAGLASSCSDASVEENQFKLASICLHRRRINYRCRSLENTSSSLDILLAFSH